jgi:hypothetical protein
VQPDLHIDLQVLPFYTLRSNMWLCTHYVGCCCVYNTAGLIDFDEFRELDKRYPLVLFPAYRLQDAMQRRCLSERAWTQIRENLRRRQLIREVSP